MHPIYNYALKWNLVYATRKCTKIGLLFPLREEIHTALFSGAMNHCPSTLSQHPHAAPHNFPAFCVDHMQVAGGICEQKIPALWNDVEV